MYDEKLFRRLKKELWGRDQHFYAVVLLQMALAVCSMIKTFLQEVMCVKSGYKMIPTPSKSIKNIDRKKTELDRKIRIFSLGR